MVGEIVYLNRSDKKLLDVEHQKAEVILLLFCLKAHSCYLSSLNIVE